MCDRKNLRCDAVSYGVTKLRCTQDLPTPNSKAHFLCGAHLDCALHVLRREREVELEETCSSKQF